MTNKITEKSIKTFSLFFLVLSNAILFYLAINRKFDSDEYEHLHTAWYVYSGYIPFKDFIEHHNILFMYFLSPLFSVIPEGTGVFFVGRIIMFIINIVMFFLTYVIGSKLFGKSSGYLSALLLSVTVVFFASSMQIRPDSIQVLFGLISIVYLLKWSETGSTLNIGLSGFFFTISLLALQKALFLFPALIFIILTESKENRFSRRAFSNLFHFASGAIIPFFSLIAYLIYNENIKEYFFYNYLFNARLIGANTDNLTQWPLRETLFNENYLMWAASILGLFQLACIKHKKKYFLFAPITSLLFFLFIAKTPYRQYYMMLMPFIACSAAFFFLYLINHSIAAMPSGYKRVALFILFVFFVAQPVNSTFKSIILDNNKNDLEQIQFILDNSKPDDLVLLRRGNVFRKDTNFNWMWSLNDPKFKGEKTSSPYDKAITDIQTLKPKIIFLNKDFPLSFKNRLVTVFGYTYNAKFDLYLYSEDNFYDKYFDMEKLVNPNLRSSEKESQN